MPSFEPMEEVISLFLNKAIRHLNKRIKSSTIKKVQPINLHNKIIKKTEQTKRKKLEGVHYRIVGLVG
jgi:hypothetical protein